MNNQIKSWYESQKNGKWKTLTDSLSQDSTVHSQLNNFTTTIYQKFRQHKNLSPDFKPTIEFKGFQGFQDFPIPTKMGHCDSRFNWKTLNGQKVEGSDSGQMSIVLSQKLLLSKLGMNELISDFQEDSRGFRWSKLEVGFNELIGTIAHEIAHAYQFLVNEDEIKSQCESTGERDSQGKLKYPQLAYEHTVLTEEIKAVTVKLTEYKKFKNWWEGEEGVENILSEQKTTDFATETAKRTSEISKSTTQKTIENTGKNIEWSSWTLPVVIISGIFLLVGIVYLIFKNHGKAKN